MFPWLSCLYCNCFVGCGVENEMCNAMSRQVRLRNTYRYLYLEGRYLFHEAEFVPTLALLGAGAWLHAAGWTRCQLLL